MYLSGFSEVRVFVLSSFFGTASSTYPQFPLSSAGHRLPILSRRYILQCYNLIKYSMLDIEELARQVQLQRQLRECSRRQDQECYQTEKITLPEIVTEINGYISEITQMALQQENSRNYIAFMQKNQQMCIEIEKKLQKKIESVVDEITAQMNAVTLKLNDGLRSTKKSFNDASRLKQQRKVIAQSILETSLIQNMAKSKSTINPKSVQHYKMNSIRQLEADDNYLTNDTHSSSEMDNSYRFSENQKEFKKRLGKVEKIVQILQNEMKEIKKDCQSIDKKAEAKIQANLESVWNVVSDLCSRVSKVQILEASIQLCD